MFCKALWFPLVWAFLVSVIEAGSQKPNILFILTDDQDLLLGSLDVMPQTVKLLGHQGATFTNAFATDPVCCPSRSSFMTGKYVHNHGVHNNSVAGNCSSTQWQQGPEKRNVGVYMKQAGYRTAFAGKYLNQYGYPEVGGCKHVPPGWDSWLGLQGNSVYYNYNISDNGVRVEHGSNYDQDYLPLLLANFSVKFLQDSEADPFFLYLAFPSCHEPADPEPRYFNASAGLHAPRTPNWNNTGVGKNSFVQRWGHAMNSTLADFSDLLYQRRLDTLKTVDDITANLINLLEKDGRLNHTFVIFTSDHGYHLGQYGLALDKRLPYDVDTRIPFFMRGPGIIKNSTIPNIVLNIDLAPTFIDVAGLEIPEDIDGVSLNPLLSSQSTSWRDDFLIEYYGENNRADQVEPCHFNGTACFVDGALNTVVPPVFHHGNFCTCQDNVNNTYHCIRILNATHNWEFCDFFKTEFVEFYDLASDPYQLNNTLANLNSNTRTYLRNRLERYLACHGQQCRTRS